MKKFFSLLVTLTLFSCSNGSGTDRCIDVECEFGVCSPDTGECASPSVCDDTSTCLPGQSCVAGSCEILYPCDDENECIRGYCDDGACRNAEVCTDDQACLPQFGCDEGTCVADKCGGVECDRGICSAETGACVNRQVCSEENEATDCVEGSVCYGQECTTANDVCADLDCDRGVCNPNEKSCTNGAPCSGDLECLTGNFCNEESVCQPNLCDENDICPRGECDRATAECVNPTTCDSAERCLDAFYCIGDTCIPEADACAVCPGNQRCEYDANSLSATCGENAGGCNQSLDCVGERVCELGACVEPTACADDALEPNNIDAEGDAIIDFDGNVANGSVCAQDTDVFLFHTDDSDLFTGQLVVALQTESIDIGNGAITLEVEKPDGSILTVDSDPITGSARHLITIGVLDLGQYIVRIKDLSVETAGIRYSVFINMLDETVSAACANPTVLQSGVAVNGNSTAGASFSLGSSCTNVDNPAGEDVYSFSLKETAYTTVKVVPAAGTDISFAIRSFCENSTSDLACENAFPGEGTEQYGALMPPGEYIVVVQGPQQGTGGQYTVTFTAEPIVCSSADNVCIDAMTANNCNPTNTGFEMETCDLGCDMALGACTRIPGDACISAFDATNGYAASVTFTDLTNEFDPGPNGCVTSTGASPTEGTDAVWRVDLPIDGVLSAELDPNFSTYPSLYIVEDCFDMSTCVASINNTFTTTERLVYFNESGAPKTVFVIADTEDRGTTRVGVMTIETGVRSCTPDATQCNGNMLETCNEIGTAFEDVLCSAGCNAGACNPVTNDICTGAIDITAAPATGRIEEFLQDYNPPTVCTGRGQFGRDAVYSFTAPLGGQIATVNVDATFDVGIWVSKECGPSPTCLEGADTSSVMNETVQFLTEANTTYYVYVDTASTFYNGTFTVSASVQNQSCTPGTLLSCSSATTLQYCGDLGLPVDYDCDGNCTNSACDVPSGEICFDAIAATPGVYSGNFSGTKDVDPGVGTSGACSFSQGETPAGVDTIYAVDLLPGEFLLADYTSTNSFAMMYLLGTCTDSNTCLDHTADGTTGSVVYQASNAETVYLVMDRTLVGTTSSTYQLTIDVAIQDCTPGTSPICLADGTTIQYCDALGFTREFACDTTCSGSTCDAPSGDICVDAIPVTAGTVTTTFTTHSINAVQPDVPQDGFCQFDNNAVQRGNDKVYVAQLTPGQTIRAGLTTTLSTAGVYILSDCLDSSTCESNNFSTANDVAEFYSQNGGAVYIVVDSSSTFNSSSSYDLTIDIFNGGTCTPGRVTCDSANSLIACNDAGTGFTGFACANGCVNGGCIPNVAIDSCDTAPTTTGTIYYGRWSDYTNDITMPFSSCTGTSTTGPDLFHSISVNPGEVLHVVAQNYGNENSAVYAITDCQNPEPTCVAGEQGDLSDRAELFYAPTTSQTVTVGADTSSSSDEEFSVLIEVVPQQCTPPVAPTCSTTGSLQFCNEYGLFETYACDGGCAANACGSPRGQQCFDAISIGAGDSYTGSFLGSNAIDFDGAVGTCAFSAFQPHGSDTVFEIDLIAGDILTASYTSGTSFAMLYLMGDCASGSTCIEDAPRASSGSLTYTATVNETIYAVMDRSSSTTTSTTFTLDIDVARSCIVGTPAMCDTTGTKIEFCDATGVTEVYACDGTCTNGACDTPSGDACFDAIPSNGNEVLSGDYEGTNLVQPSMTAGTCNFGTNLPVGTDHVYTVDLLAGETITASFTTTSSFGTVYFMSDCDDGSSCLSNSGSGASGTTSYTASANETVYVIMDRTTSGSTATFTYDLTLATN